MKTFLIDSLLANESQLSDNDRRMLDRFPRDVRTVERALRLDPETTMYAVCPVCNFVIAPKRVIEGLRVGEFSPKCPYRTFPSDDVCGAQVTKAKVESGQSVRVPIKPFLIHDLNSFIGRLISRPGILTSLFEGMCCRRLQILKDVKDGSVLADIKTGSGEPFMDPSTDELRLAWSLAFDSFNPYFNKASGKASSCGAIIMACLNLPPHLRYKQENLFLVGIIPGPKEPPNDTINHFLRPIIDTLEHSYEHGTRFTGIKLYPNGIVSRSVIAVLIGDQPASRKVAGLASHSHRVYCTSHVDHTRSNINEISRERWVARTDHEHRKKAEAWKNAASASGK